MEQRNFNLEMDVLMQETVSITLKNEGPDQNMKKTVYSQTDINGLKQ